MRRLMDIASLIRSKNAGPFVLTFDILFATHADFDAVVRSGALNAVNFAKLYGVHPDQVRFFECRNALALKFSIPRPVTQGDLGDGDMHGGQQYVGLLDADV